MKGESFLPAERKKKSYFYQEMVQMERKKPNLYGPTKYLCPVLIKNEK